MLAALLLGSRALWAVTGFLAAAIAAGGVVDFLHGVRAAGSAAESPLVPTLIALFYALLIAFVIDRFGAVLRKNLSLAIERQNQLESARDRLEERRLEVEGLYKRLETSYEETLRSLSAALDLRDRETRGHSERVVGFSTLLGESLGLDDEALRRLRWGALLHDIGKIAIPDSILHKAEPLSEHEWQIIRRHPKQGHAMLRQVSFLGEALDIVLHHHENWDGSGYPDGLGGTAIPEMARIFSVVDTYDAMISERPYRSCVPTAEARQELKRIAGQQLDKRIVDAFLDIDPERLEVVREMAEKAASEEDPRSQNRAPMADGLSAS